MGKFIFHRTCFKISCLLILVSSALLTGCATPLYSAAAGGRTDIVKELLDKGTDVNEKLGSDEVTALETASGFGYLDTVKLLIDRGADVNAAFGPSRLTSLSVAVLYGHTDVARLLVERGADINKAIDGLRKFKVKGGIGAGDALVLLSEFKREKESSILTVAKQPAITASASIVIKSDVDELPAIKTKPNKNAYAIVIGIEQYRQKLPKADFAVSDAKLVSEYLFKVMGYPEENIVTLTNEQAALGDFVKYFEKWLPNNAEQGSTIFVYYSGHGAPNPKSGDAYLVPYDGDPSFIEQTGYPLKKLYEFLNKLSAKEIIVALDSCFSGAGGRSVIAKGARPLVMNLQSNMTLSQNITVLSASSGEQISSTYDEKGHGLFTYFMLKGIKNEDVVRPDGSIKMDDLFGYIKPQVERIARKQYNNEQTPQLIGAKK